MDLWFALPNLVEMMKVRKDEIHEHNSNYLVNVAKILNRKSIIFFLSTDEVIQRANDVPYGLCASVWTENSGRIHRVASKLKVYYDYISDFFIEIKLLSNNLILYATFKFESN